MAKIDVLNKEVTIYKQNNEDYICITDIAKYKSSVATDDLIKNWLRNRNTIEFLGIWEQLNNPDFKPVEFDGFRKQWRDVERGSFEKVRVLEGVVG